MAVVHQLVGEMGPAMVQGLVRVVVQGLVRVVGQGLLGVVGRGVG